jgi:uncharacterized protein (UPF0276 family)
VHDDERAVLRKVDVALHGAGAERRAFPEGGHRVLRRVAHGAAVADPVLELLGFTLSLTGPRPVVLERDNDIPALSELVREVQTLRDIYDAAARSYHAARA